MLVAALAFVWKYGSNVPSWDGWDMVPTLTGQQPVTANWLWSQHNEHRVPVPRLILLVLNRIAGIDFRAGMFFNVFALGVLALAMIVVAGRIRGRMSYSDAFFPLLVLHWGQAANLLWGWQVQFLSSTVLSGLVLLVIVQSGRRVKLHTGLVTGICLLLLPLCGVNGLALVPPLALWLIYLAASQWRSRDPHAKGKSILTLGLAASALLLVGLYLVGYEMVPHSPASRGLIGVLKTGVGFLTIGLGPGTQSIWPFSGLGGLGLLLATALGLAIVWRCNPQERHRVLGFVLFLGAMASLGLSLGVGGRYGLETRYVTLAIPSWCAVYFFWSIYGPPRINLTARTLLLIVSGLALWPNTQFGVSYARDLRHQLGSFEEDMVAGVPSYMLISRYWRYLHINHDILTDYLPMLQRAGVGKFRLLRNDPVYRELPLPLEPTVWSQVTWNEGTAYGSRKDPYLVFALPEDRYVYGIHLDYSYSNEDGTPPRRFVYWKKGDQKDFPEDQHSEYWPTGDHANWSRGTWVRLMDSESTTTVWICDTIREIKIYPDFKTIEWVEISPKPFMFKILELAVLVPAN